MSGRAISVTSCHLSGVRVVNQPTYIPAYINAAGKRVNQKITIDVAANSHKGTHKDANGQSVPGRTDFFEVVAWGKLADIMARSCSTGKALDLLCKPGSYRGKVFNADGSYRMDNAGQAIDVTKTSFTIIDSPAFGEDSADQIKRELDTGIRPQNWNVKGHPDYELWTARLKERQATVWDGRSNTFGFARVVIPQGVQLDFSQPGQQATTAQQYTQPVQQPQQPTMPSMVQHAVNSQPVPQQPINTFGNFQQTTGYAPAPTAPAAAPGQRIF